MIKDIHIIGTGAMGCLWASYFPSSLNRLHFIQRQPTSSSLHIVKQPNEQIIQGQCHSYESLSKNSIQYLVIATKAFDALAAFKQVEPFLKEGAQVLLLQNGMGSQQAIQKECSNKIALYACSSTEGAYKLDATTLVHAGFGENHIGPLNALASHTYIKQWLPITIYHWHDKIEPILWKKLLINCAINPLTVVHQCNNGQLIDNPIYHQHMEAVCSELDSLTAKLQFSLPDALPLAEDICKVTYDNYSSMYQDFKHRRKSEVEFITGFLIRACQQHNIDCPENETLYKELITRTTSL
jgi:2-dehydropantoate 2-reductase